MNNSYMVGQNFPDLNGPGTGTVFLVMATFRNQPDAQAFMDLKNATLVEGDAPFSMVQIFY